MSSFILYIIIHVCGIVIIIIIININTFMFVELIVHVVAARVLSSRCMLKGVKARVQSKAI